MYVCSLWRLSEGAQANVLGARLRQIASMSLKAKDGDDQREDDVLGWKGGSMGKTKGAREYIFRAYGCLSRYASVTGMPLLLLKPNCVPDPTLHSPTPKDSGQMSEGGSSLLLAGPGPLCSVASAQRCLAPLWPELAEGPMADAAKPPENFASTIPSLAIQDALLDLKKANQLLSELVFCGSYCLQHAALM